MFAHEWLLGGPASSVVVFGPTGSGKTRVAKRLASWARIATPAAWENRCKTAGRLVPMPGSPVFIDWQAFASPETCTDREFDAVILHEIEPASMVIIDDLGTETDQYKTGTPIRRLTLMLNRLEQKFWWATTNARPSEWEQRWDARVEDRLLAATAIEVNAPSFRSERR